MLDRKIKQLENKQTLLIKYLGQVHLSEESNANQQSTCFWDSIVHIDKHHKFQGRNFYGEKAVIDLMFIYLM